MSAIAGASAGVKDMADGSLRITIEFEPKDAKEAYALFGARGTPVALAALRAGFAAVPDKPQEPRERVGPICLEAVQLCGTIDFQEWAGVRDGAGAKEFILAECGVESRRELDTEPAKSRFIQRIRIPFFRQSFRAT